MQVPVNLPGGDSGVIAEALATNQGLLITLVDGRVILIPATREQGDEATHYLARGAITSLNVHAFYLIKKPVMH